MTDDLQPTNPDDSNLPAQIERGWIPWLVWTMVICGTIIGIGLVKVTTRLGVKASPWLKEGHDYVWRIWIRGTGDIATTSHQWIVTLGLILLAILFLGGSAMALHIALNHDEAAHDVHDG